jgi:small subunit ribosomal protein S16
MGALAYPYHNMIVIRLTRVGKKKQPSYRLVAQDKRKDPWGKALEILGHYNPRTEPKTMVFKADRIQAWLDKGAQPSPSVHNLLVEAKIVAGDKVKASTGSSADGTKDAKKETPKA